VDVGKEEENLQFTSNLAFDAKEGDEVGLK